MFNSQTCLNSQPVAIGAYFGLKSWRQDGTARVIITSARFASVTGAGMLVHLNPRLGMVREYNEDP